jgi:hypothetical protein
MSRVIFSFEERSSDSDEPSPGHEFMSRPILFFIKQLNRGAKLAELEPVSGSNLSDKLLGPDNHTPSVAIVKESDSQILRFPIMQVSISDKQPVLDVSVIGDVHVPSYSDGYNDNTHQAVVADQESNCSNCCIIL